MTYKGADVTLVYYYLLLSIPRKRRELTVKQAVDNFHATGHESHLDIVDAAADLDGKPPIAAKREDFVAWEGL